MGLSRRNAGFSLIELMVVVTIISIVLLAFRPSFSKSLANKHALSAAAELVRFGRRARAESLGQQRAYLVFINPNGGARRSGTVSMLRGNTTHCDLENWANLAVGCVPPAPPQAPPRVGDACVEHLDLSYSAWYHAPFEIRIRSAGMDAVTATSRPKEYLENTVTGPVANTGVSICYEPSGQMQWSVDALGAGMTFSGANTGVAAGGGFLFSMGIVVDAQAVSVPVLISYSLASSPRRLR